jgi:uncharacterized protein (TIGR00661 family)
MFCLPELNFKAKTMSKKFLLVVQGEGRGHMTQAMCLYDLLIENGHQICGVILGSSGVRDIPTFFYEKVKAPIYPLQSPNFVTDKKNKSISIVKSVIHNFKKLSVFKESLRTIDEIIKKEEPDVVINFFDLLIGLYYRLYKPTIPLLCIAHQYIYFHPDFEFPKGFALDRFSIKFFTKLTSYGSKKNIALSFYSIANRDRNVVVVPPLLRESIFKLNPDVKDFYLVYLVNNGYFEELVEWHKQFPDIEIQCFTDNPQYIYDNYSFDRSKLIVNAINDKLFIEKMAEARGLASSAGFEAVCEAMYLGKPVLMVPIKGHFEQYCNSRDGFKAGAGIYDSVFNLGKLVDFSNTFSFQNPIFKNWVSNAKETIYKEICSV